MVWDDNCLASYLDWSHDRFGDGVVSRVWLRETRDGACVRFVVLAARGGIRSCRVRRLVVAEYHPHTAKISAYPITQNRQVSYHFTRLALMILLYSSMHVCKMIF